MASFLKCLDYAHDICLLSHRIIDLHQMAVDLEKEAGRVELKININKTKDFSSTDHRTLPIFFIGQNIEGVDQFVYLGGMVSADG